MTYPTSCVLRRHASLSSFMMLLLMLLYTSIPVRQFNGYMVVFVVTADDMTTTTTSLFSETDEIIDELIDAELLSSKEQKSDLLSKTETDVVVEDHDDSEEIIVLLDDSDGDGDSNGENETTHGTIDSTAGVSTSTTTTTTINNTDDNRNSNSTNTTTTIHVQSNLQSMTDEELIAICTERGYEITMEDLDSNSNNVIRMTHDDYVNAATQCLSMDQIVNQMIADDPDSAADIEREVERIRLEKETLQTEQETILQEISTLEEELRQSGIDPTSIQDTAAVPTILATTTTTATSASHKNLTDLTVDEVLYESFVQLFDRVGNDMQFVAKMVHLIIVQPTWTSMSLIWRYVSPTILSGIVRPVALYIRQYILPPVKQVFVRQILPYIIPIQQVMVSHYTTLMNGIVRPTLQRYNNNIYNINSTIIQMHLQQWYHQQREEVQLGIRIVGAFFVPLYQSLSTGYRIFLQPILHNVTVTTMTFLQQQQQQLQLQLPLR